MAQKPAGAPTGWGARVRKYAEAAGVGAVAYISGLVGVQVAGLVPDGDWLVLAAHAAFVVMLLAGIPLLAAWVGGVFGPQVDRRRRLLACARHEAHQAITEEREHLVRVLREPMTARLWVPHDAGGTKKQLDRLYRSLETSEGLGLPGTRINFRADFMTMSADDGNITVASWANRQNRAPVSLRMRAQDPSIYSRSVTADLYRESREKQPASRLIESTLKVGNSYQALYPGQKQNIRSTVIHPVLSLDAELLGTLVLHCDRENYFKQSDYTFWCELLEPVASRIALEREWLGASVATVLGVQTPRTRGRQRR